MSRHRFEAAITMSMPRDHRSHHPRRGCWWLRFMKKANVNSERQIHQRFSWAWVHRSLLFAGTLIVAVGLLPLDEAMAQIRIMPLGNSITDGIGSTHGGGYRLRLYELLSQDANLGAFDLVGQRHTGSGFPDLDHEGHPGFTTDQLEVEQYLSANPADIVLLEIGTNDVSQTSTTTGEIANSIASLLDRIHAQVPDAKIFLGTLLPRLDDKNSKTNQVNSLLIDVVNSRSAPDYKVFLVPQNERFVNYTDWRNNLMADVVHPNNYGYELMAEEWYDAIKSQPSGGQSEFVDHFDRSDIGADWTVHEAFQIYDGQLVNTSSVDAWDHFFAICNVVVDPNILELTYGPSSDEVGRSFTGLAVMLTSADLSASGYLIFHNYDKLRMWTIINGSPTEQIATASGFVSPRVGDVLRVEITSDQNGHHFSVFRNGTLMAVLNDPAKRFNGAFGGLMINGNTHNGVDDFLCVNTRDNKPPAQVTDLHVIATTFSSVVLEWTAPGNDDNLGKAASYDLRYSTTNIVDDASFNVATPVPDPITPSPGGTIERLTVNSLKSGTTYYFALKAADEAGNVSELSNEASGTTSNLLQCQDNFNRANGNLGEAWGGDLTNMQIRNNAVQNVAVGDIWSAVIYKDCRNVVEVTLKYGAKATTTAISYGGILMMMDAATTTANGYMIQRFSGNTPADLSDDLTRLWLVQNGRLSYVIDEGQSQSPHAPKAGSKITVRSIVENNQSYFYVYVDDEFDRVLSDPNQSQRGLYAGFMLESTLGEQNAVDEYISGTAPAGAKAIEKILGDNQFGFVNQPLPLPLTVALIDSFDNPLPGAFIKFAVTSGTATITPPPSSDGNIRLEAEETQITSPMERRNDPDASGGKYIVYPTGQTVDASATFTFEIKQAGTYRIWTRSLKPGLEPGSWTIKVDAGSDFIYDVFRGTTRSTWTWDLVSERGTGTPQRPQVDPKIFNFVAGTHTIIFKARYADTRLDKILITSDPDFVPSGKEESGFITDDAGQASANVTFGPTAGMVQIQASHGKIQPVTFTATATGDKPEKIVPSTGNNQSGSAGQTLSQPFKVIVQDKNGNGVAGQTVSWLVTAGNGTLSHYTSSTDANGIAATTLTLGNSAATNLVEARIGLSGSPVVFTATTTSGLAATAAVTSPNPQTGIVHTALAAPLVAKVTTASGHVVPNFPVEFKVLRGGGSLNPTLAINNAGFEVANTGTNLPADWTLEGAPGASEVSLVTTGPYRGAKCLQVNAARDGVGVSQMLNYPAPGNYTLSFWIKVSSGIARLVWRVNDASGNSAEKVIDILPVATGNAWTQYILSASNSVAVPRSLSFKTSGGPGSFLLDEVKIARNTDSNGEVAVNWTLGDTAMTQMVQAEAKVGNTVLSGSPMIFSAKANPGAAKKIVPLSATTQFGSAGQTLSTPLTIKVIDQYGNAIANRSVKFTVKAGGGKLNGNLSSFTTTTKTDGQAQATLKLGPTPGDTNKVEVTSSGLSPVMFIVVAAVPSKVTKVPGWPTLGSAGYRLTKPLGVRVADAENRRISGIGVYFKIRQGGGKINDTTQVVVNTDSLGEARAYLTLGPNPGAQNKVEAWITYNNQTMPSPPLAFVVKAAALKEMSLVAGNNQSGTVCDPLAQPFKVRIIDSLDAGIKNQSVKFTVIVGGGKLANNDTVQTVMTDAQGYAQAKLTLGPKPGTNQVTARTTTTLKGSPQTFTASGQVGAASALKKVSGDSLFALINTVLPFPQVVRVVDKCGNGLAGVNVKFKVKAGGGKVNDKDSVTVVTDNAGKAQVAWKLGSVSGYFNNQLEVRASNGTADLSGSPQNFVAGATPNAARSMKAQSSTSFNNLRAGTTVANNLVVKVTDGPNFTGNGVPGHLVRFTVTKGGGHFANGRGDTTVTTDQNGLAQARWTLGGAIGANSQEVRATSTNANLPLEGSPVIFVATVTAGFPSALTSEVQATGPIPADGQTKSNVTIYIRDQFGNAIAGEAVTILVKPSGNNFIDQPTKKTNEQGITTGAFASTSSGTKIVTAKVLDGIEVTRGAAVQVNPLAPQNLLLESGNNQTCNLQAAVIKPLSVKVRDKHGNGVPHQEVRFNVKSGGGRIYEVPPIRSDSNGIAAATYIGGTQVGQSQIWAEASGLANSPIIFIANVVNSVPRHLQARGGNGQRGQVGQILPQPLVVRVTDKDGRPVFGVPVKMDVAFGGGTLDDRDPLIVNTNELGEARAFWRLGPKAGPQTVRVESEGLTGSPIDFSATAVSGFAEVLTPHSGQNAIGEVAATMAQPLCVRVTDGSGNGVDSVEVLFELIRGTGSLSPSQPLPVKQVLTKDGGFACVQITFDQYSGWRKVRASAPGLRGSPVDFDVYGKALAAQTMKMIDRTNNQSGTKAKPLNFPLQVLVQDRLGNPVPNEQITFVITSGGGNFIGGNPLEVRTDSSGIASAQWILGRSLSQNEANAVASRNTIQPMTLVFKATGYDNNFPIFDDVPDRRVTEGDKIEFAVLASDPDGDPLRYGAKNLPPTASFDSLRSRIFSWEPGPNSKRIYEISFMAYDNRGGYDEELVIIEVINRNQRPEIVSRFPVGLGIPTERDTVIELNTTLLMRVNAIDPDGDPLNYRWFLNGKYAGSATNTYLFRSPLHLNRVEVLVFDQEDTVSTSWLIQVPVQLNSFSAELEAGGGNGGKRVLLEWRTAAEFRNAGFNVLRSRSKTGRYEKINREPIPARRDGQYRFVDDQVEAGGRYFYKLEDVDVYGNVTLHGPVMIEVVAPQTYVLHQNYPNPYGRLPLNLTTQIRYEMPRPGHVTLCIYNELGQEVQRLVDREQTAGYHLTIWNGRDQRGRPLPSGIYYYRLQIKSPSGMVDFVATKKLVMTK